MGEKKTQTKQSHSSPFLSKYLIICLEDKSAVLYFIAKQATGSTGHFTLRAAASTGYLVCCISMCPSPAAKKTGSCIHVTRFLLTTVMTPPANILLFHQELLFFKEILQKHVTTKWNHTPDQLLPLDASLSLSTSQVAFSGD